jgi:hypothetical protein
MAQRGGVKLAIYETRDTGATSTAKAVMQPSGLGFPFVASLRCTGSILRQQAHAGGSKIGPTVSELYMGATAKVPACVLTL